MLYPEISLSGRALPFARELGAVQASLTLYEAGAGAGVGAGAGAGVDAGVEEGVLVGVPGGVLGGAQAVKSAARPSSAVVSQRDRIGTTCLKGWLGISNLDWRIKASLLYTAVNTEAGEIIPDCETLHLLLQPDTVAT